MVQQCLTFESSSGWWEWRKKLSMPRLPMFVGHQRRVKLDRGVVLVVEDDAHFRKLMQVMLPATLGVRAVVAEDGNEALEQLRQVRPAVVLLDLSLPELDGMELIRELKSRPATQGIPLVAVTARAQARGEALAAGCDDFIEKPFELDDFIATVRKYLPE